MEELDAPSLDSGTGLSGGSEKTREQSEKQKESYKKAQAQIQRSQKDEKKAKWDNEQLFHILERFIQNPYYEDLIPLVTDLLARSVPSRYILSMIGLFYPEAAIHILTAIGRQEDIRLLLSLYREESVRDFDESSLHPSIRTWMSVWVQSSQLYITHPEMSIILQDKLVHILSDDVSLVSSLADGLLFFFQSRNLRADKRMMMRYAEHIVNEHVMSLKKSLSLSDEKDLFATDTTGNHVFFWLLDRQ